MRPNFFIVGAPKAGTTSLAYYLSQQPDIFMCSKKEIHFFGKDLSLKRRKGYKLSLDEYLDHFTAGSEFKALGEASVLYLSSTSAANEIYEFNNLSKIIVMLRNPVDMMISLHAQLLSQADEDIVEFSAALDAEKYRRSGSQYPKGVQVLDDGIFYRNMGKIGSQLKRYYEVFPRDNIHIIFFDDFIQDSSGEVSKVRKFLGLPNVRHCTDLSVKNPATLPRFYSLNRLLYKPTDLQVKLAKMLFPRFILILLKTWLLKLNIKNKKKSIMPDNLRSQLLSEFEEEITLIESITGKDLSHWRV